MSASLHEQLADELGVSPDDAEAALRDYLDDVQARAQAGETVTIPGLGTVTMDEGELHVIPSAPLQEAVNYRNTHLAPITISEAPAPPPVEEDEPPPEEEAAEPEEPAAEETVPDLSDDWTVELEEEEEPTAETPSSPAEEIEAPPKATHTEEDGPTTGQIAGLIASVILLFAAVGYVLTTQGLLPGFGPAPQTASPPPATADTTTTASASDTTSSSAAAESPDTASTPPASPQGIDRATGGWTIVVASRTQAGEAEALLNTYRQRFRGEGLPTDVLTGESDGQRRYRIAVGQYDSRAAAMTALQQLEGRIPSDAWPLQIASGS